MSFSIILLLHVLLEIYFLIVIGSAIGAFNTILWVIISALLGMFIGNYVTKSVFRGVVDIHRSLFLVLAATLLIIPGFLTDLYGILFLIPLIQKIIIKYVYNNLDNANEYSCKVLKMWGHNVDASVFVINTEEKK